MGVSPIQHALSEACALEIAFRAQCRAFGYDDEWAAYRAEASGVTWPAALVEAHAAWMQALHGFYLLRDGPKGVLGGRGV